MRLSCSVMSDSATPWTVARQAPPSMGFSRQEYWSGLPFPTPGGLPDPRIEPVSLGSPALEGRLFYHCADTCKNVNHIERAVMSTTEDNSCKKSSVLPVYNLDPERSTILST